MAEKHDGTAFSAAQVNNVALCIDRSTRVIIAHVRDVGHVAVIYGSSK